MKASKPIQDAARETGLSPDTLRYYERIGLIGHISRTVSGQRDYGAEDIRWIQFLRQLRATGMPIAEMKLFAELRRSGDVTSRERRQMLEVHRKKLERRKAEIDEFIDLIDRKIARHRAVERRLLEAGQNGE